MAIKRKNNWFTTWPPSATMGPLKPQKVLKTIERKTLIERTMSNSSNIELSSILPSCDLNGVKLEINYIDDNYDGNIINIWVYTEKEVESPNKNYERDLKYYNKEYKEYKEKKALHVKELEEWKLWVAQEKAKETENQVKWAERILKAHKKKTA